MGRQKSTVTKPEYLTLVLQYCTTQTVEEYEGRGWGGSVGGRFITHDYNHLLFCFAFVIFLSFFFLFTIVIRLKRTQKIKILVI